MTTIENNAYFGMRNPNFIVDFPENAIFRKIDLNIFRKIDYFDYLDPSGQAD